MTSTSVRVGVKGSGLIVIPVVEGVGCVIAVCVEIFGQVFVNPLRNPRNSIKNKTVTVAKFRNEKLLTFQPTTLINKLSTYKDFIRANIEL